MAQNRYYSSTAAQTSLNGGISNSQVTITVNSLTGYPVSLPWTGVIERDTVNEEVVTVTGVSALTLTVTRGADGTAAVAHSSGATFEHGVSARDYNEPQAHIAASGNVHGIAGSVVGTTDAQVLSNKTLLIPVISQISNTGTLLLPTSSDTLVGRATTDTLTNKTLTSPTLNTPTIAGPTFSGIASGSLSGLTATGATFDNASTIGGVSGTLLAADRTAWTAFTPTFTNVTGGVVSAAYRQIGKILHVHCIFTAGTATATGVVGVRLPSTLASAASQWLIGSTGTGSLWSVPNAATSVSTVNTVAGGASLVGIGFSGSIEVA